MHIFKIIQSHLQEFDSRIVFEVPDLESIMEKGYYRKRKEADRGNESFEPEKHLRVNSAMKLSKGEKTFCNPLLSVHDVMISMGYPDNREESLKIGDKIAQAYEEEYKRQAYSNPFNFNGKEHHDFYFPETDRDFVEAGVRKYIRREYAHKETSGDAGDTRLTASIHRMSIDAICAGVDASPSADSGGAAGAACATGAAGAGKSPGKSAGAARAAKSPGKSAGAAGAGKSPGKSACAARAAKSPGKSACAARAAKSPGESACAARAAKSPGKSACAARAAKSPGGAAGAAGAAKSPGKSAGAAGAARAAKSPGKSAGAAGVAKSAGKPAAKSGGAAGKPAAKSAGAAGAAGKAGGAGGASTKRKPAPARVESSEDDSELDWGMNDSEIDELLDEFDGKRPRVVEYIGPYGIHEDIHSLFNQVLEDYKGPPFNMKGMTYEEQFDIYKKLCKERDDERIRKRYDPKRVVEYIGPYGVHEDLQTLFTFVLADYKGPPFNMKGMTYNEQSAIYHKLKQEQSGADKPASGADKPTSGADKPTSGADKPTSGADKPASGADKPTSGADKPASGAKKGKLWGPLLPSDPEDSDRENDSRAANRAWARPGVRSYVDDDMNGDDEY